MCVLFCFITSIKKTGFGVGFSPLFPFICEYYKTQCTIDSCISHLYSDFKKSLLERICLGKWYDNLGQLKTYRSTFSIVSILLKSTVKLIHIFILCLSLFPSIPTSVLLSLYSFPYLSLLPLLCACAICFKLICRE